MIWSAAFASSSLAEAFALAVLDYLKGMLDNTRRGLLLVSYWIVGTRGHAIQYSARLTAIPVGACGLSCQKPAEAGVGKSYADGFRPASSTDLIGSHPYSAGLA